MKIIANTVSIVLLFLVFSLLLNGCGDENYNTGLYWLNKEKNPTMAVRYFQRSLKENPDKWKTHQALLSALSELDDVNGFERQLIETFNRFPKKTKDESIYRSSLKAIGEMRYNRIRGPIEQLKLGRELGKKGDKPDILARITMSSCRMQDTLAAVEYFKRLLIASGETEVLDTVIQELGYIIGPSGVKWLQYEAKIDKNPKDVDARLAQINAGLIVGDSSEIRDRLSKLLQNVPDVLDNHDLLKQFGLIAGVDPFRSKRLVKGWDGSFSPDGKSIVYIKDRGRVSEPDQYLYTANANGGNETPIMKGAQQRLNSLAWPCYSPDGRWIYFFGSRDAGWSPGNKASRFFLYRIKPRYGSSPQKLTDEDLIPAMPRFNKDGSVYVVKHDAGSHRSSVAIIKIIPDKKETVHVSRIGEPVNGATFSANGDSLIFITDRGIFRRSVDGGKITVDLALRGLSAPFLAPDGKYILVSNRKGHALLIDRNTSKISFLGSTATSFGSFSSNGRLLLTMMKDQNRYIVRYNLENKADDKERFLKALK
ncbi:MAG: PD40 domain-containing protein [Calditrichaeota bacterium]|nr:PD40 domain-containing protein [Calditrichota bacterium]